MDIFHTVKVDFEKVGAFLLREMKSVEDYFGRGTGPQKLKAVADVVALGLEAVGVPAALVNAGDKEFKAVVDAIVAWDKKLGGALIGGAPAGSAPSPAKPA